MSEIRDIGKEVIAVWLIHIIKLGSPHFSDVLNLNELSGGSSRMMFFDDGTELSIEHVIDSNSSVSVRGVPALEEIEDAFVAWRPSVFARFSKADEQRRDGFAHLVIRGKIEAVITFQLTLHAWTLPESDKGANACHLCRNTQRAVKDRTSNVQKQASCCSEILHSNLGTYLVDHAAFSGPRTLHQSNCLPIMIGWIILGGVPLPKHIQKVVCSRPKVLGAVSIGYP